MKLFYKLYWLFTLLFCGTLWAQYSPFQPSEDLFNTEQKFKRTHYPGHYKIYTFNLIELLEWAREAPMLSNQPSKLIITLPNIHGGYSNYWVYDNSAIEPNSSLKTSNIRSLKAVDTANKGNHISISISDIFGLHMMGSYTDGSVFYMDAYTKDLNAVILYKRNALEVSKSKFNCFVNDDDFNITDFEYTQPLSYDNKRRSFRLALACTTEYANFHITNAPVGVPKSTEDDKKNIVLAAMNVTITRINHIFERDINVHLNLISNNKDLIFINADNFSNNDAYELINESQSVITSTIGSANFDIGHTFSTGAGGLAVVGSVCKNSYKASGVTGQSAPVGDPFDVDYVAHELAHQFGAFHTFNNSCQNNRSISSAMETGSGSTIMSYAGICFPNVQSNVDAYYHYISIKNMQAFLANATCAQQSTIGNSAPIINNILSKTIPYGTPFVLTTTATDADGDQLTYTFEQINSQIAPQPPTATSTIGPAFRSLPPSQNNWRSFPNYATVLDGSTHPNGIVGNQWERLATVSRNYTFAATVRDNNPIGGRVAFTEPINITVANTGPFVITYPSNDPSTPKPIWYMGDTETITWNVAGTTANNINVNEVNILISTDAGATYTTLVANTPNDGTETITLPTNLTSTYDARIKIEAVGNIFYTVSKKLIFWDPNLSAEKVMLDNLKIYPNPTTSILNIEFSTTTIEKVKFDIFDLNGKLIKTVSKENSSQINQQINVEDLQAGTYILVINTGKYNSTHKFIKK